MKIIKKQNKDTQKRIIRAIIELPEGDVKKLKGMNEVYRLSLRKIAIKIGFQ